MGLRSSVVCQRLSFVAALLALLALLALACGRTDGHTTDTQPLQATPPSSESGRPDTADGRPAAGGRKTILFIGTSLTAGYGLEPDSAYPQQIGRMLDSAGLPYDAVNAGVSGETSAALLRRTDWLMRQPFDVVVIETGANDGLRGIPVDAMRKNIQQVLDRIRAARPGARVALVQMEALPNMGAAYAREFHAAYGELARTNQVTLLPFLLRGVAGREELNQADGIHPNYVGERIVTRNVWRGLRQLLQ